MFYERLVFLCSKFGTDVSNVLRSIGLSTSKGTAWKGGAIPKGDVLLKLANYFHVSTDYLLGNTDDPSPAGKEKAPLVNDDEELTEYLEQLRNRPEMRMLFSVTKRATKEDVEKAVAIIEALRKAEGRD